MSEIIGQHLFPNKQYPYTHRAAAAAAALKRVAVGLYMASTTRRVHENKWAAGQRRHFRSRLKSPRARAFKFLDAGKE